MGTVCCQPSDQEIQDGAAGSSIEKKKTIKNIVAKPEPEPTELEKFVRGVIASGEKWTDPDFPPEASSLYDSRADYNRISRIYS